MKERSNIILIGMPGAGKSTLGVVLAKELGMDFSDTDLLIQKHCGKLLKDIIAELGVEGFLKTEEDVCADVRAVRSVIATGGSVVYGSEAMRNLKESGIVVYLRLPYEVISERLANLKLRGVALKEGQTLRDIYDERVPLYEKWADLTVDEEGLDLEETLAETKRLLSDFFSVLDWKKTDSGDLTARSPLFFSDRKLSFRSEIHTSRS